MCGQPWIANELDLNISISSPKVSSSISVLVIQLNIEKINSQISELTTLKGEKLYTLYSCFKETIKFYPKSNLRYCKFLAIFIMGQECWGKIRSLWTTFPVYPLFNCDGQAVIHMKVSVKTFRNCLICICYQDFDS